MGETLKSMEGQGKLELDKNAYIDILYVVHEFSDFCIIMQYTVNIQEENFFLLNSIFDCLVYMIIYVF